MKVAPCLGCDDPMDATTWHEKEGICPACEKRIEAGRKVKNSGGDLHAGRGLRSDSFVY